MMRTRVRFGSIVLLCSAWFLGVSCIMAEAGQIPQANYDQFPAVPRASVQTILSDSFNRSDADNCSLGQADLANGGSGSYYYLPIFPGGGANIVSNALQNNGADYGGVQITTASAPCSGGFGMDLGQDLYMKMDLKLPTGASSYITAAGPYFRSRSANSGDGIIGGSSAGYWVQLFSTGQVKIKRLNPQAFIAAAPLPASFDNTIFHTLEIAFQGENLQVALDGILQTFDQNGCQVTTVSILATSGSNDGAAGIAFSAEDNRGMLGGQQADNLLITGYQSIPLETNGKIVYLPDIRKDSGVDYGAMVSVPAGNFQMGCSPNADSCAFDEPLHTVYLDAYDIDKYEVTNARYAKCVAAGGCTAPHITSTVTHPSYYGNPAFDSFPVVFVDWNQATAFCAWEGRRLPTEAEWEKAARGSRDTRIYPWGDTLPDCTLANFVYEFVECVGDNSQVGSYPSGASPYGALDMAGNVYEWVSDWFQEDYYSSQSTWNNPTGPASGPGRVYRSGTWANQYFTIRVSSRYYWQQTHYQGNGGFRCARSGF